MTVSCGERHTLSIGSEIIGERQSSVFAWGDNSKGQCGVGDAAEVVIEPRRIEFDDEEE